MPEQSFFAVLYRPFSCIFYALQYKMFGFSAYGYFLTTIILHALNAILFFFLLRRFVPLTAAYLATLFFAFHISFWDWIGWISGQEHIINCTLILIIIHLVKYHLDSKKILPLLGALAVFLISLFTRETAIFFPFWLPCAVYLYRHHGVRQAVMLQDCIRIAFSFLTVSIVYLGIRLFFYPLKTQGQGIKIILNPIAFIVNLKHRFFDAVTFLSDIANLSWLGGGHRFLKGSFIILFIAICFTLFLHNKNKKLFLFFVLSGFLFMWPALLRYYSSRYLYKVLPFFIMGGLCLITNARSQRANYSTLLARIAAYIMVVVIIINTSLLTLHMKQREQTLHQTEIALKELVLNQQNNPEKLCFVALPNDPFITGVAQALRMFGYDTSKPIYYDQTTFVSFLRQPDKNPIALTKNGNQLHLISLDPNNVWFCDKNIFTNMGTITVNKYNDRGNPVDMDMTLDAQWIEQPLRFVTWDYQAHRFVMLDF